MISILEGKIVAATKSAIKARYLASIIGKIISMSSAIGPVNHLMTRRLYTLLNSRVYWCQFLTITPGARLKLSFWQSQIHLINGREI